MHLIINLNKPSGITSQQAVARIKKILGVKKAGHAGTLDPLATGVLLVCLNEATKVARFLQDMQKRYRVRLKLGQRTDTYDSEGTITEERDISSVTVDDIRETVSMFYGRITQKPPMYSAVKVGGEPLYKLARKGLEIERDDRMVEIYDLEIKDIDIPFVDLEILCSKGTYVRTLSDDIGMRLNTGAHVVSLERTAIGFFCIRDSARFEDILILNKSINKNNRPGSLPVCDGGDTLMESNEPARSFWEIDDALAGLAEVVLNDIDYQKALHGSSILLNDYGGLCDKGSVRLKGPSGNLFGFGRVYEGNILKIERLLNL